MKHASYNLMDYLTNRRLFVSVGLGEEYSKGLKEWLSTNSLYNGLNHSGYLEENPFYHITLWYSKTGYLNPITKDIPEITLEVENWELLGKNKEHLTLKFKPNKELNKIKDEYEKHGLTSEWPTFKPHMTMVYHYNKNKIPKIKPPKEIKLGKLFVEETIDIYGN